MGGFPVDYVVLVRGGITLGTGREGTTDHEVRFLSLPCLAFEMTKFYVLNVLFNIFFIQAISGVVVSIYVATGMRRSGVCEGHDTEVPRTGMCMVGIRQLDGSPSTRRWTVEVYVPPGPHQGSSGVLGHI